MSYPIRLVVRFPFPQSSPDALQFLPVHIFLSAVATAALAAVALIFFARESEFLYFQF